MGTKFLKGILCAFIALNLCDPCLAGGAEPPPKKGGLCTTFLTALLGPKKEQSAAPIPLMKILTNLTGEFIFLHGPSAAVGILGYTIRDHLRATETGDWFSAHLSNLTGTPFLIATTGIAIRIATLPSSELRNLLHRNSYRLYGSIAGVSVLTQYLLEIQNRPEVWPGINTWVPGGDWGDFAAGCIGTVCFLGAHHFYRRNLSEIFDDPHTP